MAQEILAMKARPLGKEQVMCLIDIISKNKIVTSKATTASNNKLKDDAWKSITEEFNATTNECRRPDQLRLKWENLKKAARKRNALIRENNFKMGRGRHYIIPDEGLDRVASILNSRHTEMKVEIDDDIDDEDPIVSVKIEPLVELHDLEPLSESPKQCIEEVMVGSGDSHTCESAPNNSQNSFIYNTHQNTLTKRKRFTEEVLQARKTKDLAIAAYFKAKTKNIKLLNIKLQLEIDQIRRHSN